MDYKMYIDAILHTTRSSISIKQMQQILLENGVTLTKSEVLQVLQDLSYDYENRSYELKQVNNGYRLQLKSLYFKIAQSMLQLSPPRLSAAATETLSLIAYRQPITRAEIEQIRGVSVSSYIIKTLMDLTWIKVVGHKECPGRPAMFATTKEFLEHFSLNSIAELPPVFAKIETNEIDT